VITNGRQTIGTAAVMIDGRTTQHSTLYIHNDDTTKDLFIGSENVTAANGFKLAKLESKEFYLPPLNDLYVVSSGNAHNVSWIRVEQD